MKKTYTLLLAMTGLLFTGNAQSIGDYRSAATGDWSNAATWQRFNGVAWVAAPSAPTSTAGVISILTGHIVTVNSTVTADQIVVNTGGTLTQVSDLNLNNGTGNDLTVNGTWNFSGNLIGGPGNAIIAATGTLTLATVGNKFIGAAITNNGTINWQDGGLFFETGVSTVTNNATMNISGNNGFQNNVGTGTFINTGTVTKTSTGTTTFGMSTASNSGTINVNGGTIDCTIDFTNTANLSFNTGNWNQTFGTFSYNAGSVISGTGGFNNGGGAILNLNINLVFPSTLVFSSAGTISGAGNLTINNAFTIEGTIGGAGSLTINANSTWNSGNLNRALIIPVTFTLTLATAGNKLIGAAITNNGTINWQDGGLFFQAGVSTVTNNGTMNISGNNGFQNNVGTGTFINTGTVTKTSTGTTTFGMSAASNSGTINVNGGTIDCTNDFTNTANLSFNTGNWNQTFGTFSYNAGSVISGTGSFTNGAVATLNLNTNLVFPSTLVFSNTGTISGVGNLTINNDFTFGGIIGGAGTLTINANSTWNDGALGRALIIPATRTLTLATTGNKLMGAAITNNGTINWQDGGLFFNAVSTVTNNGAMNISGNNGFQNNGGSGTFINTGTVTKTSTGTTTFTMTTASNSGTINVNGGTIDCTIDFTNTANLSFNTGNWNQTFGTFSYNAGSVISGTGSFTNGATATLDLNSNLVFPSTLVFSSTGTISGPGNLTINNDFTFGGTIGGAGTLTINANSTWNSGALGRALIIPATRTLTLATTGNKFINAAITNNGTINWQDGGLFFQAGVSTVTNNGTMNISGDNGFQNNGGSGTFINTGTVTKTSTGITTFGMSTMTNSTGATIRGLGTMDIAATTFNSNGFIAPGLSPGLLTINTGQPLSANSTLNIEMLNGSGAGTGHDQLLRNGNITLAGTLTVTQTGTVPNGTYTIINLVTGTVSGSFATTNLPAFYSLQVNASNVRLIKNTALPLTLLAFTAQKTVDNKVNLKWVTTDEQNVSHFEVERSPDGTNYTRIAIVRALNSPVGGNYSYRDETPPVKINYYRLRMVDLDASYKLSPVRRVSVDKENYLLTIYPNPATDIVQVDFSSGEKYILINIFDMGGKLVMSKTVNNDLLIKIPVQSLSAGVYSLQVSDGIQKANGVFVKQ